MKKIKYILHVVVLLLTTISSFAQQQHSTAEITAQEIEEHVKYFTSNEFQGRKSGEKGNTLAAKYIAKEFSSYGLKPMGERGDYFQYFKVLSSIKAGDHNRITVSVGNKILSLVMDQDFRPMVMSSDTFITAGVVFVGYGIVADTLNYDDYAGLDVQGKIVMALRSTPDAHSNDSKFYGYESSYLKAFTARNKGAIGLILVTGPTDEDAPSLVPLRFEREFKASGIPVMNLKSTVVDSMLRLSGIDNNLKAIQQTVFDTKKPKSFELPHCTVSMRAELVKQYSSSANVLGYLEGNDPVLKNQVLVIGAHYDHLGWGGPGSGSLSPDTVAIHHGADDNASGSAGILELAQYFSAHRATLKRSILFTAFSGEEMGLLGSNYYVKNPVVPLESTITMLNLDMVGRMRDSTIVIDGMGTSPQWESIVKKEDADSSFRLKLRRDGYGPSDHASFYSKDIPVMFFFTDLHSDYHRPSDTWDKINYSGEQKILEYIARITTDIMNNDARPVFTKVQPTAGQMSSDRQNIRVSLGVLPDYAEDVVGLKITGTRAGSAAEKGGLKGGDIIVKFGGKDVKNIYDYMYMLANYKPGDEVTVVVKRGTEEITLKVFLEERKQ